MKKSMQKGFTLIELMIVVAIVAILAAIALPLYQDYVARSQVAEGVAAAGAIKTSITEYHMTQGDYPPANQYQDTTGGRYTATVGHDENGVIEVTMRNDAPVNQRVQGFEFTMAPIAGSGDDASIVDWNCTTEDVEDAKYLPSGCQAVGT